MNNELQFNLDIVDKRGPNVRIVDIIDTRAVDYDNFIDNILVSLMFRGYMLEDVGPYVEGFNYITKTYKLINNNVKFNTILINCKIYGILNYEYYEDRFEMVGKTSGKVFKLGDPCRVRVERCDKIDRVIDFGFVKMEK